MGHVCDAQAKVRASDQLLTKHWRGTFGKNRRMRKEFGQFYDGFGIGGTVCKLLLASCLSPARRSKLAPAVAHCDFVQHPAASTEISA